MSNPSQPKWQQSYLGGGGYITGFLQHPQDPNILYARCDVAGVFKSEDRGASWQAMNQGMHLCHHHSVRGLAIDPHNPHVLLRHSGEARGGCIFGDFYKSVDNGRSWYQVTDQVDAYGNGPSRMYDNSIAFSRHTPGLVAAGGYASGVWLSEDTGERWRLAGLKGERISFVTFHPHLPEHLYVATVSDHVLGIPLEDIESRLQDFRRGDVGKLYRTVNRGETWELLWQGATFTQLAFAVNNTAVIFGATKDGGILKSADNGRSWVKKSPDLPERQRAYNSIVLSPDGQTLFVAADTRGHPDDVPPIPIYRSTDGAESWQLLNWHTMNDLRQYPDYMTVRHAGWAISQILVDWADPQRLYLANWYGVAVSPDGGLSWNANNFSGTETICGEAIVCDPVVPKRVYFTMADHAPAVSHDNGRSYTMFAKHKLQSSTALAPSRFRDKVVIYGAVDRGIHQAGLMRTEDGGKTVELTLELGADTFVQALAEDPHHPGTFYTLVDGEMKNGAGLYQSQDWGQQWQHLPINLPTHIQSLPHNRHWIEAELLSVVVYQVKNACGSNQLLQVDPHQPDVLYWGEWTEGIFRIDLKNQQVTNLRENLPFGRDRSSVLVALAVDEKRPFHLYAGFIREGLWRSTDGGTHWEKLFPQNDTIFNASAIDMGGPSGDEIVVASEPLYWSQSETAVYHSKDLGKTWQNLTDPQLGAIRWKGIALERTTGTIHGIACGNGCYRLDPKGEH